MGLPYIVVSSSFELYIHTNHPHLDVLCGLQVIHFEELVGRGEWGEETEDEGVGNRRENKEGGRRREKEGVHREEEREEVG